MSGWAPSPAAGRAGGQAANERFCFSDGRVFVSGGRNLFGQRRPPHANGSHTGGHHTQAKWKPHGQPHGQLIDNRTGGHIENRTGGHIENHTGGHIKNRTGTARAATLKTTQAATAAFTTEFQAFCLEGVFDDVLADCQADHLVGWWLGCGRVTKPKVTHVYDDIPVIQWTLF